MLAPKTYSFLDTQAAINGPGGAFNLGQGAGVAKEGISVAAASDAGGMSIGADGSGMHSLYADKSGEVTVRLLKTSPTNALLSQMLALQRASGSLWGQNTITITNTLSGDSISCQLCAFKKWPDLTYAEEGGMNEWTFNAILIDQGLGAGTL